MIAEHLAAFRPRCVSCGAQGPFEHHGDLATQGRLICACGREIPVLDGVPLWVRDLPGFVQRSMLHVMGRSDVDDDTLSWITDCAGPESAVFHTRSHRSTYAWDHWGPESSVAALTRALLELDQDLPPGPLLDVGCAMGRASLELHRGTGRPVLGVDLNLDLLRCGQTALRTGHLDTHLRQSGVVFTPWRATCAGPSDHVDLWAADATALPLADQSVAGVCALNLLDSIDQPWALLQECARVLRPGGLLWLATPFDWSPSATPMGQWLGGHSQRGPAQGDPAIVLERLLGPEGPFGLERIATRERPWTQRLSARTTTRYTCWIGVARKTPVPG